MFQRGRADYQHALDAEQARHDLDSGEGLDGLAQSHLIADEHTTGPRREQGTLGLIAIEAPVDQGAEVAVARAEREGLRHGRLPPRSIAHFCDEAKDIVVAPELVVETRSLRKERLERRKGVRPEQAVRSEVRRSQRGQCSRAGQARSKSDFALRAVLKHDFTVRRLEAALQHRPRAPAALEPAQHELDVLAGAQGVRTEVGTGAVVVAQRRATDRHAVHAAALRIGDLEVREDRFGSDVRQAKQLLAPVLTAQGDLPFLECHVDGLVLARKTTAGGWFCSHGSP